MRLLICHRDIRCVQVPMDQPKAMLHLFGSFIHGAIEDTVPSSAAKRFELRGPWSRARLALQQ